MKVAPDVSQNLVFHFSYIGIIVIVEQSINYVDISAFIKLNNLNIVRLSNICFFKGYSISIV